jgi:hypothetical protein
MPIKSITLTPEPGCLIHSCAGCGAVHRISFNRGAQKTKTGPFTLRAGDTLVLRVDAMESRTASFAAKDFPDLANISAAQLASSLNTQLPGVQALDDAGGVLIESASTGDGSRIEVVDGTARAALGFPTDGRVDPCHSRPVLGISVDTGGLVDKNIMALRRCNDCGANECLVRTFDELPPHLDGTHFKAHRKAVNALTEHCKSCGWSHADVAQEHAAETVQPLDMTPLLDVHSALSGSAHNGVDSRRNT